MSSPSIITLIKGSVPEGLINVLPFPLNSSSKFCIACKISSFSSYLYFLFESTFALTNTCGYIFMISDSLEAVTFFSNNIFIRIKDVSIPISCWIII